MESKKYTKEELEQVKSKFLEMVGNQVSESDLEEIKKRLNQKIEEIENNKSENEN
jgi:benzoyl-CoA reductase/2-hydroxyglutaryl-CoA dehydratase subunit BcrC/BadD/HgdB